MRVSQRQSVVASSRSGRELAVRITSAVTVVARHAPTEPFPLSDSLEVAVYRNLALHEMGHGLGPPHNYKADGYSVDSVRQSAFVRRMGFTSVMSYSSNNFITQPDDHMPVLSLTAGQLSAWG